MSFSYKAVIKWDGYNVTDVFKDIALLKAICLNPMVC